MSTAAIVNTENSSPDGNRKAPMIAALMLLSDFSLAAVRTRLPMTSSAP